MKTTEQRRQHFIDELQQLLNRHGAEIVITDDGKDYGMHSAVCEIYMDAIYNDDGDLLADFSEFRIGTMSASGYQPIKQDS